jgi:threonyl-tRNA synthetase
MTAEDAFRFIGETMHEPYKLEYAQELVQKRGLSTLSFYKNGSFMDMCEGPHVNSTRELPAGGFKLRSIAGAYWRGDSNNIQMTRIYAWAYKTPEELQQRIKEHQLALDNDHKKLGKQLDLFFIDEEIGKGLPLWMPNGTVLRDELEKLAKEMEFRDGYQRVSTPHLARTDIYYRTGHLPYYASGMFPFLELKEKRETASGEVEEVLETYALKPMNCPHHHKIFASRPRSYRDLLRRLWRALGPAARARDVHERRAHLLHRGSDPRRVHQGDGSAPPCVRHSRLEQLLDASFYVGPGRSQGQGEVRRHAGGLGVLHETHPGGHEGGGHALPRGEG